MAFISRSISTILKKSNPMILTRNFGGISDLCCSLIVEFKIHSVADEETIEVEVEPGTSILDVCREECVDVTGMECN